MNNFDIKERLNVDEFEKLIDSFSENSIHSFLDCGLNLRREDVTDKIREKAQTIREYLGVNFEQLYGHSLKGCDSLTAGIFYNCLYDRLLEEVN